MLGSWALVVGLEHDADVKPRRKFGSNWFFVEGSPRGDFLVCGGPFVPRRSPPKWRRHLKEIGEVRRPRVSALRDDDVTLTQAGCVPHA